jgi:H+/Cl- antiporter ClcA
MFLGTAAGIMASHLPDLPISAAVPVCMAAAIVSILRLPLSAIVVASLLCTKAGPGPEPLVIIGVAVAYLTTLGLSKLNVPAALADEAAGQVGEQAPTGEAVPSAPAS